MKLTDDNLYITYILENRTQLELMQIFGLTRRQIQISLKEAGLTKHSDIPKDFVRMYEKGLTYMELAEYFDVECSLINSWRKRLDLRRAKELPTGRTKRPDDDTLYTLRILEEKKVREIAELYEVATTTASGWLRRAELVDKRERVMPDKEQLRKDYDEATGNKRKWIGEKYGVAEKTANDWLNKNGIKQEFRPPMLTYDQCIEAIGMKRSGMKTKEVSGRLNVNKSSLIRYMHNYKLFDRWKLHE